jgi:3-deoxy-D-manno-octulosonic-acid transferase
LFFLYNLLLTILAGLAIPFFLVKLVTTQKYRKGLTQRLGFLPESELAKLNGNCPIWVHAVSVGETMAAVPLVRELRRRYPERKILVSTVTATGHLTARSQVKEADGVIFFPFDLGVIVRKVLQRVGPALFVLMETEIWPNCVRTLADMNVPILIVNGRISTASYRGYRRIGFLMKRLLPLIGAFSMQTEEDARRIMTLGAPPERVKNCGNIKFDRQVLPLSVEEKETLRRQYLLPRDGAVLIAGSTHATEEAVLIEAYRELRKEFPGLVFILAPRHPERAGDVETLLREAGLAYQKRSRPEADKPVLLLDTVGELSRLYGLGTVSFVGGSLVPVGGHNILEPAVFGVPVVYGPHMENFPEISAVMADSGGGIQIGHAGELQAVLRDLLGDREKSCRIGRAGMRIIEDNQGALEKTLRVIDSLWEG